MCTAVIHNSKRKLLRGINASQKAGKVSKMTNALDVRRLPAQLKTSRRFLRRLCQHIVSRMLNEDQKAIRMGMAGDLNSAVNKDPTLLNGIVNGDQKWCFLYNKQSKRASATWKSPQTKYILRLLRESIRKKRPKLGDELSWVLLENSTPAALADPSSSLTKQLFFHIFLFPLISPL
ncbi:hypothetical protein TNCV_3911581 [Trichonephila clavipes]|nr:hypothetical protein TNCV_3911581 [Trichonephila clavipes]